MRKILVISQKELVQKPIFKQDKNLIELFDILTQENEVQLLYLHKNTKDENKDDEKSKFSDITTYSLRDMMHKNLLKKNLKDLIEQNKFETIIFTSYYMAQIIMPYIEEVIETINIIVDFRLSPLEYVCQQYKDEREKNYQNFQPVYRSFKINFLQSMAIIKNSDYLIFDKDTDTSLLKKEKITNIILISEINKSFAKNRKSAKKLKMVSICINSENFSSKIIGAEQVKKDETTYVINNSKYSNLADKINTVISDTDADYFFICNSKLTILPDVLKVMEEYLQFNDNIALTSPLTMHVRDNVQMQNKISFAEQRNNNFSNWEEGSPLLFSDCFMIKKAFVKKIGYFDNNFKTLEYALFDFILRLYQTNAYYFIMKDIPVFKSMSIKRDVSLFKEDKIYLCNKWRESDLSMEA